MSRNWLVKRREVDYALFLFTKWLGFTLSVEESSIGGYRGIAQIVVEFSRIRTKTGDQMANTLLQTDTALQSL